MHKKKTYSSQDRKKKRHYLSFFKKIINKTNVSANGQALKITFIYFLSGCVWVLLSDKVIIDLVENHSTILLMSTIKGWLYMIITSTVLYFLVFTTIKKLVYSKNKIETINSELEKSNILFSSILESSPEIVIFSIDSNYSYTAFNNRHKDTILQIWGKEIQLGKNSLDIIGNEEYFHKSKENFDRALAGESFTVGEEYGDENLTPLYLQYYYSPIISNNGKIIGLTCFALNITALKKAEEENIYLSYHDGLTSLYNRRFYEEELKKIDTETNYPISIIMGDVNGLKFTNDVFGHQAGDKLLRTFADILKKEFTQGEIVAKIGGDEFAILLQNTDYLQAQEIILKIQKAILNQKLDKSVLSVSFGCKTKYNKDQVLEEIIKQADDLMYHQKLIDRKSFKRNIINQFKFILYGKDSTEQLHSERVSELCVKIGTELGLSQNEVDKLELSGLLHDIGKIAIDENLLNKIDKLTEDELYEVKRHSEIGYKILNYFDEYKDIAEFVLYHHERIDGTGYPKGLKGDEIPLVSKIISISDAYDIMNNNIYKDIVKDAVKELKLNAKTQFDVYIAKVFVEKVLGEKWS